MRCPMLHELPAPAAGKTGWPWTEEMPQLSEFKPDGTIWPVISIVLPSFNHGDFLEETLRSILLQGYPNLELIVIDGGSRDRSLEVIKQYEPWLAYWVSEPDCGIFDGYNKGVCRARGDWLYFIGSGDILCPGAFRDVFSKVKNENFVYGRVYWGDYNRIAGEKFSKEKMTISNICHQGIFYKRCFFGKVGLYNLKYHTLADWAFNIQCFGRRDIKPLFLNSVVAFFKRGGNSTVNADLDIYFWKDRGTLIKDHLGSLVWFFCRPKLGWYSYKNKIRYHENIRYS